MRIVTLPGVFRPRSDTWLLAQRLEEERLGPRATVLDVCTGSGALAVFAASRGAVASAVDVSRRAVLTARLNARLNGVRVRARRGDLFFPYASERFDAIVSNPPYLPGGGDAGLPDRGAARAWEGGPDGRVFLDRISREAAAHLRPGGVLLIVQSSVSGEATTLERLRDGGLEPAVADRRSGPLGPLLSARAPQLERQGRLEPGVREEELLVIRAQVPSRSGH